MIEAPLESMLSREWHRLLTEARLVDDGEQVMRMVIAAYASPARHYHNLLHLQECLAAFALVPPDCPKRTAIQTAIWFHDIVYDARASDNEIQSAELARRQLALMGASTVEIQSVHELILDTRHTSPPASMPGRFMVDIDLSIFGQDSKRFNQYEAAIRQEYAHVADVAFRNGRASILHKFLSRESIYMTEPFQRLFEAAARENLNRSLKQLESSY